MFNIQGRYLGADGNTTIVVNMEVEIPGDVRNDPILEKLVANQIYKDLFKDKANEEAIEKLSEQQEEILAALNIILPKLPVENGRIS